MINRKQQLTAICVLLTSVALPSVQAQSQPAPGAPQVRQFLQPSNVNDVRRNQILGIVNSDCSHVMSLMMQNNMRSKLGTNGTEQLHLPHLTTGLQPGDLQLLNVNLVSGGSPDCGPIFQIGMKNCSNVPIGNFHVSMVGVLGRIQPFSPSATIRIPRMEAGEETQIQIQLPASCMCMGPLNQQAQFDCVVVALDSFDCLLECDELNNVQILKRAEIGLLVAQAPQPEVQQQPVTPVAPAPIAPSLPDRNQDPLDNIDVDKLVPQGQDQTDAQSLQLTR